MFLKSEGDIWTIEMIWVKTGKQEREVKLGVNDMSRQVEVDNRVGYWIR